MGSIFISYSHEDDRLKERVVKHLSILPSRLDLWEDSRIKPGENWYERIQRELRSANAAVLLVSADFLTSNFILKEEVPQLLERREREGLYVTPLIARPCAWQEVTWLRGMQLEPKDGKPLSACKVHQVEKILAMLAVKIAHHEQDIADREHFGIPLPAQRGGSEKPEGAYKVLVVDDHPIVRLGVAQTLDCEPDLEVVGMAEDAHEAVEKSKACSPDIVLMDISLRDMDGFEATKIITQQFPNTKVLVFSMHWGTSYAKRALLAGAMGYVLKTEATEKLPTAIRCVRDGGIYLSKDVQGAIPGKAAPEDVSNVPTPEGCLSDREREVFHMIGEGYSTREIADKLHLSVKTVETYRAHIKEKLGLQDANELLRSAIKWASAQGEEAE